MEQVRKFMRSKWPENTPFDTIIVPVTDEPKSTHADSVGRTQIVELSVEKTFDVQNQTCSFMICATRCGASQPEEDSEKLRKIRWRVAHEGL